MSEKKINLDEILLNELEKSKYGFPEMDSDVYDNIKIAMKEACRQILELAAENSKIEIKTVGEELIITDIYQEDNYTRMQVNIQSILDTIKQIE